MKKFAPALLILILFAFAAPQAKAQLTFYNGTPCAVRVLGSFNFAANPCLSNQSCVTSWITVPAGQAVTIPGISTNPCLQPAPPAPSYFRSIRVLISPTQGSGASICGNPSNATQDCQGNPRTVQMFNFNFAAIY